LPRRAGRRDVHALRQWRAVGQRSVRDAARAGPVGRNAYCHAVSGGPRTLVHREARHTGTEHDRSDPDRGGADPAHSLAQGHGQAQDDQNAQGLDSSFDPGLDSSFDPGLDSSFDPGFDSSFDPGFDSSFDPRFDSSLHSSLDPGLDSSYDSELDPGFDSSYDSELDSGFDSGRSYHHQHGLLIAKPFDLDFLA
jgi:hypothetical protein